MANAVAHGIASLFQSRAHPMNQCWRVYLCQCAFPATQAVQNDSGINTTLTIHTLGMIVVDMLT